ncbi:MAG: hypothetical protein RI935_778 [Candidatus Parcubacteria bacterium]|jgi:hypothetical protein
MTDTSHTVPQVGLGNTSKAVTRSLGDWTAGIHPNAVPQMKNPCARHVPGGDNCRDEIFKKGRCPLIKDPCAKCTGRVGAAGSDLVMAKSLAALARNETAQSTGTGQGHLSNIHAKRGDVVSPKDRALVMN